MLDEDNIDIEISIMFHEHLCWAITKTIYTRPIKGKRGWYKLIAWIECDICGKIVIDFRDDPNVKKNVPYENTIEMK